eukprot:COSAG02_NODE_4531_length_5252_cov_2.871919_2_plen_33_part_00
MSLVPCMVGGALVHENGDSDDEEEVPVEGMFT